MSTTTLAIIAFVMLAVLMYTLISGKVIPVIAFILLPVIAALAAGFGVKEINAFVKTGLNSVLSATVMFMFSITYFNIMNDAGFFEPIIRKLIPAGKANVFIVLLAALATTYVGHLDGSGATTWMIVLTAFIPLADRIGIRRTALLCIIATGMTAANLIPWGGPTLRAASVLEMDVNDLFRYILPSLGIMVLLSVAIAWIVALNETKNGAGKTVQSSDAEVIPQQADASFGDPKWIFNALLTAIVLFLLFKGITTSYLCFMIGVSIALLVNYPDAKEQSKRLKSYAGQAMMMTITLFSVAVFLGIMKDGGFVKAMATVIVDVIPASLASHTHWLLALLGVPMMMALGTDAFYYIMLPVIIGVVQPLGIDPLSAAAAFLITGTFGTSIAPGTAAMYVGLGLADVDVGTHIKFSIRYLWPFSIICLLISMLLGIVQF